MLPNDIVEEIIGIPAGLIDSDDDRYIWQGSTNGTFSVKTAYNLAASLDVQTDWEGSFLWKIQLPPRVKAFFWLLGQNKLLTNAQRFRRSMTNDPTCSYCGCTWEDSIHCMRGCTRAKSLLDGLGIPPWSTPLICP